MFSTFKLFLIVYNLTFERSDFSLAYGRGVFKLPLKILALAYEQLHFLGKSILVGDRYAKLLTKLTYLLFEFRLLAL